uniref:Integrin alpha-L-like n=1 Tax=Fundulus heteroclitus TaxID=8078 RepID=A0A3Q2NSJ3_FUNHE
MYEPQRFYLLVYMVFLAVSSGFNIDTANPTVHSGDPEDFFGYKVLQYMSPRNKGIIVTAPLRLNGSGGIFKHDQDETEKWFSPNGIRTYPHLPRHLGLSIAADSTGTRFIACSPSLAHPCDENVYLNSLCYNVTNEFQQLSSFKPLFQNCTKKAVDLVFLFDGSESMTGAEFNENKIFIKNVMKSLKNTTFKFAAVQFSTDCRKVFDFNDYVAGTAIKKLDEEQHMNNLTNTHKALKFTLSEILENQAAGASKYATKAVVIITDGDPSDLDTRLKSVETYERKKIIRIVIGVSLNMLCCINARERERERERKEILFVVVLRQRRLILHCSASNELGRNLPWEWQSSLRGRKPRVSGRSSNDLFVSLVKLLLFQRIRGADFHPRLRFFGQAINGDIDLGDDRLPDIVVGSKGSAVVLRSKSVLNVKTSLSFYPNVISIQEINCLEENEILPMVTVRACFEMAEATNSTAEKRINISVMLNADSTRSKYRGFFIENKEKKSRNTTHTYELTGRETCFNYSIYMNKCVKDILSPVHINLYFSQPDGENASAILNVDSKRWAVVEVPFEKCVKKEICIADLKLDFNFTNGEVLVTENTVFSVLIILDNIGDDSYNTSLTMHYPPGLSFSTMKLTGKLTYICTGLEDVPDKTVCDISLPVYRSKSSATFNATFRVAKDFEWNETVSMSISAKRNAATATYLDLTAEKYEPKRIAITYNISNTGFKDFPINVSLFFPSKLEHNFEVKNYTVIVKQVICPNTTLLLISTIAMENCIAVNCDTFTLKNYSGVQFILEGIFDFQNWKNHESNMPFLKQYTGDSGEVSFMSFIKVDYDDGKYVLASHKNEVCMSWTVTVLAEFTVPPNILVINRTVVLLGTIFHIIIAIILWKVRFLPPYLQP